MKPIKNIGVYVHVPFCVKKCDYCDFISYCDKSNLIEEYIEKLKQEITNNLNNKEYSIKTIYIGGGTPSSIDSKYIVDILNTIKSVGVGIVPARKQHRNYNRSESRHDYRTKVNRLQKRRH